jgi:hypothetical protein
MATYVAPAGATVAGAEVGEFDELWPADAHDVVSSANPTTATAATRPEKLMDSLVVVEVLPGPSGPRVVRKADAIRSAPCRNK